MTQANTALTDSGLWAEWMRTLPERLRGEDGIKAQFAAAAAVISFLNTTRKDAGWTFLPTAVGQWEDTRIGVDGYLVCRATNEHYAVDFSLEGENNPKGNKRDNPWLVHLKRDWFKVAADGTWVLRAECLNALTRAFLNALRSGPVAWKASRSTAA